MGITLLFTLQDVTAVRKQNSVVLHNSVFKKNIQPKEEPGCIKKTKLQPLAQQRLRRGQVSGKICWVKMAQLPSCAWWRRGRGPSTKAEVVHQGGCWLKRTGGLWVSGGKVAGEDSDEQRPQAARKRENISMRSVGGWSCVCLACMWQDAASGKIIITCGVSCTAIF